MNNVPNHNTAYYYIKHNVLEHEYAMHKHIYHLGIVNTPKIIAYDRETKVMVMEKINFMNLSDFYGEDAKNISSELFAKIKAIIKTLYINNIVYPDITGYNFVEYDDKIWILDFEHADFRPHLHDAFVEQFIADKPLKQKWNPQFK